MLLLVGHATTPDELEIVTGTAADIDVHVSHVDSSDAGPPVPENPDATNTLITTATTTVIATAPTSASKVRNVKTVNIRNRDSADTTQVTVQIDANSAGANVIELHSVSLAPGEALEYVEGVGWFKLAASPAAQVGTNKLTGSDQALGTSDTYLNNSALPLTGIGALTVGRCFHWRFIISKTAAGTATPIIIVRVGTAGSTSDTARVTFTWGAGTAAVDRGEVELDVMFTAIGASAVLRGKANWTTNLSTTGLSNAVKALQPADSGTFDATVANSVIGLSYNAGASGAHTMEYLSAFTDNF
jgi:hypothetical protein